MMRGQPLVSIVVPAYNHASYLAQAIESILNQDYPRIELIVLDDGSTDGTRQVLEAYGDRFHWETQPNIGQANTLNKGWRMSVGEILSYLSADDILLPQAVSRSVECLLENSEVVLTYCDFNLISADSRIVRRIRTPDFDYREMLAKVKCPPGPGTFFTRSAFELTGNWDVSLRAMLDYDYWLRLGLHGRFIRIPEVLAQYRVHENSQTVAGYTEAQAAEPILIVSRFFKRPDLPANLRGLEGQTLSNAHLICAQLNYRAGRYQLGSASARKAFAYYPRNFLKMSFLRLLLNIMLNRVGHRMLWKMRRLLQGGHG